MRDADRWTTVRVRSTRGIAWVELHRPEKPNAMNPVLNRFLDAERGRERSLEQFRDDKRIKPGLQANDRPATS